MSRAPDHEPEPGPASTNWARVVLGLLGLVVGIAIITLGVRGF
jgi:hypothetical protein